MYYTCILYEVKKQGSYFPMLMTQLCKVRWLPLEMTITEALNGIKFRLNCDSIKIPFTKRIIINL